MRKRILLGALVAAAALTGPAAFAQDSSPNTQNASQQHPKKAKRPTVWTDDNINSVRSPSEIYQMQEEKKAGQEAAAKKASSEVQQEAAGTAGPNVPKPKTAKEADDMIAHDEQHLQTEQQYVEQTKEQLKDAPESDQARLHWRIKSRSQTISRLQSEIALLQKERDDLAKKANAENGSANAGAGPNQQ